MVVVRKPRNLLAAITRSDQATSGSHSEIQDALFRLRVAGVSNRVPDLPDLLEYCAAVEAG